MKTQSSKLYTIVDFDPQSRNHLLRDAAGKDFQVDIMVDRVFNSGIEHVEEPTIDYCKSLIGQQVEVGFLVPFTYLGSYVTIMPASTTVPLYETSTL